MRPSIRSRIVASATAFVLGFGVANYGILRIPGRDRWLWFAVAIVLMLTSVVGVLLADSRRRISMWAVIGAELLVVFTALPLLWTFTLATSRQETPTSLLPQDVRWSVFGDALGTEAIRQSATTSALVALIATVLSLLVAVPAAYALVRRRVRGRRAVYFFVLAALLAPLIALAGPFGELLRAFGVFGSRLVLVAPTMMITLPLAMWLSITWMRDLPWTLRDSIRADGGTRRQQIRAFVLPAAAPTLLTVAFITFIAACNDAIIGATLTDEESRTLPATLLLAADQLEQPSAAVAATGLLWLVPAVLVLLALPRRTIRLLGRTY
ncbi:ABC transporter permease subunit [Aeromicrobium sp.]|uniref:ABC transporter permease subunit n=1 Tax=Aeromicrobium sp. TaxID=1871063 RepID=UPI003D6B9BA5